MRVIQRSEDRTNLKCSFVCNEAIEMLASLHVMADPDHHPACSDWAKRKYSLLSPKLKEEIDFFGSVYAKWYFIMDIAADVTSDVSSEEGTVEILVDSIRKMEQEEFAYLFLGLPAFEFDREELRKWIEWPDAVTKPALREQAGFFEIKDVIYFLKNMEEIKQRLIWVLENYWEECFSREWDAIRDYEESVLKKERIFFDRTDPIEYMKTLHPGVKVEDGRLIFQKNPDYSIAVSKIRELIIFLSVFSAPHLYGNIVGGKVNITMNLNFHSVKLRAPVPKDMFSLLTAVSDETRIRMMKILWNGDATTKEMSELLELSPSTISLHLKILKEAQLVETNKVKKFVYYKLIKDSFYKVQESLIDYFEY
ncbi:ArsR/SmtB family transcription factor [Bacilliculturomica massiliensis]|uniref:ArsR/SmtB family transcription factor n=1 Tax=Bacilliculturomica massiliensis TaxID=1917867 RepID=UPI0013EF3D2F|nr:winged helix-turn-helix domain-containing protein [Bacilliculturomica massiliensis]